jgi:SNF2 family DNA or RNA helicase
VVVCPSTLVVNWSNEFDKWLGAASQPKRVTIQEGGVDGLQQIRTYMQKTNQQVKHQPGQVLIVSYEFFRRNVNIFDCKGCTSVGLLVLDEGHRLKNAGDSRTFAALASLPTDARLCITATPIQNNLCEFFNLADFCCPGILGPNVSYFRKNYERPISATNHKNATRQQLTLGSAKSKEFDMILKTFMIRRLQKDVLKTMLPPRTEALLFCRPTKVQCELYRTVCSNATLGNISDALTTLIMLRKICAHPLQYSCPDGNESKLDPCLSNVTSSGKMFVLHTLLQQIRHDASDDKVVIVSNFTSILSLVERLIMQPCSYSYLRLDGTTKDRQSLVDTFNRTSVNRSFCLLLSSKAGGCGLYIIGANRLIMFGKYRTGNFYELRLKAKSF